MSNPKLGILSALVISSAVPAFAARADVSANTKYWFAVPRINNQSLVFDYQKDSQTGDPRAELVGDSNNPGFYIAFDSDTDGGLNQGRLLFRVRVAAFDTNTNDQTTPTNAPGQYGSALFIGIDANVDGKIDLFVAADDRGTSTTNGIKIFFPACGNKTPCFSGPSTTSLGSEHQAGFAPFSTTGTKQNFNWTEVSSTTDPRTGVDLDVSTPNDDEGKNSNYHNIDAFFSFAVDVNSIANALATLPTPLPFTSTTPMRFIAVTGQNQQSFNQDTGGCDDKTNYDTWSCAFTDSLTFDKYVPLPEPGTYMTMGIGLAGFLMCAWRRKT